MSAIGLKVNKGSGAGLCACVIAHAHTTHVAEAITTSSTGGEQPSLSLNERPTCLICVGMAGYGKTTGSVWRPRLIKDISLRESVQQKGLLLRI